MSGDISLLGVSRRILRKYVHGARVSMRVHASTLLNVFFDVIYTKQTIIPVFKCIFKFRRHVAFRVSRWNTIQMWLCSYFRVASGWGTTNTNAEPLRNILIRNIRSQRWTECPATLHFLASPSELLTEYIHVCTRMYTCVYASTGEHIGGRISLSLFIIFFTLYALKTNNGLYVYFEIATTLVFRVSGRNMSQMWLFFAFSSFVCLGNNEHGGKTAAECLNHNWKYSLSTLD